MTSRQLTVSATVRPQNGTIDIAGLSVPCAEFRTSPRQVPHMTRWIPSTQTFNPSPALTYRNVLGLNVTCRTKRTQNVSVWQEVPTAPYTSPIPTCNTRSTTGNKQPTLKVDSRESISKAIGQLKSHCTVHFLVVLFIVLVLHCVCFWCTCCYHNWGFSVLFLSCKANAMI
jgi:hypothetical protein